MAKKKPKQKVRGRRKIARGRSRREIVEVEIANEKPRREIVGVDIAGGKHRSPRILRQLSARGVKRGGGIAGGNPTGMSWSSVKIDNTAYTWGTGVALPGGSRHEVEGESEIVEKKTRREARRGRAEKKPRVEREREIADEKPTSEVEKER